MWTLFLMVTAQAGDDPFATQATVHTLDNGLIVILEESHRTDTVALHLAYGVGSRDEGAGEFGCAHLFEHLMFEGSANVPTNQFDGWLTQAGGGNNAWTSEDLTAYHMTFPSGAIDLALFLESDRMGFLDSGLNTENVENQQLVVLQERNEGYAEPNGRDWDSISRLTYPEGHPYHHPIIGSVADIEGFAIDKVQSFWDRHYRSRNAVLTLVGAFDSEEVLGQITHWFSDVPDRGDASERPVGPAPRGDVPHQHGVVFDEVEDRSLYIVWPTVPVRHADAPALELLSMVLSGGRGTRMDDALYYDKDLATSSWAWAYGSERSGQFLVAAGHHKTPLKKLYKKAMQLGRSFVDEPPTEAALHRARQGVRTQMLDQMEAPWNRAEILTDCQRFTGEPNCGPAEWARYEAVTVDDLVRVAKTYLIDVEPQTLSVVPIGDTGFIVGAVPVELP
jgi:zinc protease